MNSTNRTHESLVNWLDIFGFSKTYDIIYVYVLTPCGLISLALNLFSFVILQKLAFKTTKFFRYMRLYVLNSVMLSLFSIGTFIFTTRTIFEFTNTHIADVISNYFIFPTQYVFYFYGSILEICIIIERSQYFLPRRFKKVELDRFKLFFLILFLISVIIQLPFYFYFEPVYADVQFDENENTFYRIWYYNTTSFATTLGGKIINFVEFAITDLIPLILKIIMNILLVCLVKQYMNRIKIEKISFANKISSPYLHAKVDYSKERNDEYITKTERNQTRIGLLMSLISLFEHVSNLIFYFLYYFKLYSQSNIAFDVALFVILMKHSFNIIILYKFNFIFRMSVIKIFRKNL